jgi:hypothetical protein
MDRGHNGEVMEAMKSGGVKFESEYRQIVCYIEPNAEIGKRLVFSIG